MEKCNQRKMAMNFVMLEVVMVGLVPFGGASAMSVPFEGV